MSLTSRSQVEAVAQQEGLSVEYSTFRPTEVLSDERLVVHAPFYPLMGRRALEKTIRVIETKKSDEVLARAVEAERANLKLTPGMLKLLRERGD